MKKLVVFGLLAAIGAVTFINRAQAAAPQGFCQSNPSAPQCGGSGGGSPNEGGAVNMNSQNNGVRNTNPNYNNGNYNNGNDNNGNGAQNDWRYRHHRGYGNGGSYGYGQPGVYFNFGLATPGYRNRCSDVASRLRYSGFYNVRPINCGGSTYAYSARRDGQRFRVYVSANSGRIRSAVPY